MSTARASTPTGWRHVCQHATKCLNIFVVSVAAWMLPPCCVQLDSSLAGTTWSRPPFLPDGWEYGLHEGRIYFQQPSTGLTRWEPPEGSSVRPLSLVRISQLGCDQWRLGWQEMPLGAPPPLDTEDSAAGGESDAVPSSYDPFAQPTAGPETSTSDSTYDPFSQPQQQSSSSELSSSTTTFSPPTPAEQPAAAPPASAPPTAAAPAPAVIPGSSSGSPGPAAANGCICPMVLIQKDPTNEAQYLRCHLAVSTACQMSYCEQHMSDPRI